MGSLDLWPKPCKLHLDHQPREGAVQGEVGSTPYGKESRIELYGRSSD
jgi:hypothetical protein